MTATLTELPFTPHRYDVHVVLPWSANWARTTSDEAEAIELALGQVGPNQTQVSIDVGTAPFVSGTFAVRHITWKNGQAHDSGWRCWVDNRFVGGVRP